jgi:hypothetical protein
MATSGTYLFNPDLAEIVDEAFERCRIDPALIGIGHVLSARRSMRFMLSQWATTDYHDFRVQTLNFTTVAAQAAYGQPTALPDNIIDILQVVLRRDGADTELSPLTRSDYLGFPSKTLQGRPGQFFIDKQRDGLTMTLWPVPENSTDTIVFSAVLKFEDSDTASDNADIPWYMHDAFAAGLAARLAEKYAPPELEEKLWIKAERSLREANNYVRERGDVRIVPVSGRPHRRGGARSYR